MTERAENVYDRRRQIASFQDDFIQRTGPDIDVDYWKLRVQQALAKHGIQENGPLFGVFMGNSDDAADYDGHRFYLSNVTKKVPELAYILKREFPGCEVKHERCKDVRSPDARALVECFRTWILVTHNMQRSRERRIAFRRGVAERCRPLDICLLVLCISLSVLFFTLLDRHWDGYENPWRNLFVTWTQLTAEDPQPTASAATNLEL